MEAAPGDLGEANPGGCGHRDRKRLVGKGRVITELAVGVLAPAVGHAVVTDGQAVVVAGGDLREVHTSRRSDRHRRGLVSERCAVAELSVGVPPP